MTVRTEVKVRNCRECPFLKRRYSDGPVLVCTHRKIRNPVVVDDGKFLDGCPIRKMR